MESRLKQAAADSGKSVNQTALEALRRQFGLVPERRRTREHDDLDQLLGQWTEAEFQEIQSRLEAQRQVDAELWS